MDPIRETQREMEEFSQYQIGYEQSWCRSFNRRNEENRVTS